MSHAVLTRRQFNMIIAELVAILRQHDLRPQIPPPADDRFDDVFEKGLAMILAVEPKPQEEPERPGVPTGITDVAIDHISLKWAITLRQHGIDGIHYNETMNSIRNAVADVLEAMGYERPNVYRPDVPWWHYRLWIEIAHGDLPEEAILERRTKHRKSGVYFEE